MGVMTKEDNEEDKGEWTVRYKLPTPGLEDMVRVGSSGHMITLTTWGREGGGQAVTSLWDVNEGKQLPGSAAIQTGIDVLVIDPYIFSSGNTRFPCLTTKISWQQATRPPSGSGSSTAACSDLPSATSPPTRQASSPPRGTASSLRTSGLPPRPRTQRTRERKEGRRRLRR